MEAFHLIEPPPPPRPPPPLLPPPPLVLDQTRPVYQQLKNDSERKWFDTNATALLDVTRYKAWDELISDYKQEYPAEEVPERKRMAVARLLTYGELEKEVLFARSIPSDVHCSRPSFESFLVRLPKKHHHHHVQESKLVHSDATLHVGYYEDHVRPLMHACCHRPVPSPGCYTPLGPQPPRTVQRYEVMLKNYWPMPNIPYIKDIIADVQIGTAYKELYELHPKIQATWAQAAEIVQEKLREIKTADPLPISVMPLLDEEERNVFLRLSILLARFNQEPIPPLEDFIDNTLFKISRAADALLVSSIPGLEMLQ